MLAGRGKACDPREEMMFVRLKKGDILRAFFSPSPPLNFQQQDVYALRFVHIKVTRDTNPSHTVSQSQEFYIVYLQKQVTEGKTEYMSLIMLWGIFKEHRNKERWSLVQLLTK